MRYRDFIQNITITFLALLSLFLFSRTQFFQLGAAAGSGTWQRLTAPASDQISDAPASDTLSAPVRAAVTGEYGRYGSISLTTDSERLHPHQNPAAGGSWAPPAAGRIPVLPPSGRLWENRQSTVTF